MKRIIIGTLVASLIFFAYQSVAWMSGFHDDFALYTPNQDSILQNLEKNLDVDGLYYLPSADQASPDYQTEHERLMKEGIGKPWVMIFYHTSMESMNPGYILLGFLYTMISCLLVSLILYYGNFASFPIRFLVSMAFAVFTLTQGVFDELNWWSYPWSFIKPQVIDLTLGWGLCSVWLGWFVRK